MSLSHAAIVGQLKGIVGADYVVTGETVLRKDSIDRFRKFPDIHGIYTSPTPAAVVKLGSIEQISRVLNFMNAHKTSGVPHTGVSATEGGLGTVMENSVILDGPAVNQVIDIDIENMQAAAQCGVSLEVLEDALRGKGYTTGHSPQSKSLAQMNGLMATCSIGQFSTLHDVVEDVVAGLGAVLTGGTVTRIKNVPRRAANPGIRHTIIGNGGTLCYITEVTMKVFRFTPENNLFHGCVLEDMKAGFNILYEVMVEGYRPSIARLYDAEDDTQYFTHFVDGRCVLTLMAEDNPHIAKTAGEGITEVVARCPQCQCIDSKLAEAWFNSLNQGPDKVTAERVQILKTGNMGFTTGASDCWSYIHEIYESVISRTRTELPYADGITILGGYPFHSYQNGTNIHFVYDYNVIDYEPEEEIDKYHDPLNKIICEETIRLGGLMMHHHDVGKHRTHWNRLEHGNAWILLEGLKKQFDLNGIVNTGAIYPIEK